MIPVSFTWDTRKKSICIKWKGILSFGWKNGKGFKRIIGISIPFRPKPKKIRLPSIRWVYLKEVLSFLKKWELKQMEGTLSFSDPMVNGLLYGLWSAVDSGKGRRKINLSINFLGENWCSGEATVSPKTLVYHLARILRFLNERKGRRSRKGGE